MLHFSKRSDEETNSSTTWMAWGRVNFQQNVILAWTIPLSSNSKKKKKCQQDSEHIWRVINGWGGWCGDWECSYLRRSGYWQHGLGLLLLSWPTWWDQTPVLSPLATPVRNKSDQWSRCECLKMCRTCSPAAFPVEIGKNMHIFVFKCFKFV